MNTKQFLSDILDEFNKIDYVKPEDIPNIDLYMDQVTTGSLTVEYLKKLSQVA